MQYFCPKCGEIIQKEEISFYKKHFMCKSCHSPKTQESTKKQQTIYLCPGCLSYIFDKNPKNSLWKKTDSRSLDHSIYQILEAEVINPLSLKTGESYTIEIPPITEIPTKFDTKITKNGNTEEIADLTFLLKNAMCKTCNKLLSKRFDAVIQLRTIKIKSYKPKELLNPIIDEIILYASNIQEKQPEQFLSDIEEFQQGFDLKLSSKSMMNSIQAYLTGKYSFIIKNSKKLMGKNPNTGGDLYRSYMLLRLIPFQMNSCIRIRNTQFIVKSIHSNRIILENMDTKSLQTRTFEFFEKNLIEILEE